MPIYYGSTEITEITNGSNNIDEVYYGNDLVFSSGLPVWKYRHNDNYAYLVGEHSTNGYVCLGTSSDLSTVPIVSITGTLGTSGSMVKAGESTTYFTYVRTVTLSNKKIYEYLDDDAYFPLNALVLGGSVVGSAVAVSSVTHPTSVSTSSMVFNGNTWTQDTSYYKRWSKNGVK